MNGTDLGAALRTLQQQYNTLLKNYNSLAATVAALQQRISDNEQVASPGPSWCEIALDLCSLYHSLTRFVCSYNVTNAACGWVALYTQAANKLSASNQNWTNPAAARLASEVMVGYLNPVTGPADSSACFHFLLM